MARVLVFLLLLVSQAFCEPYIPEDLKPWVGWVREANPERDCALGKGGERVCSFLSELAIEVSEDGAQFSSKIIQAAKGDVLLPGGGSREDRLWPQQVTIERAGKRESLPILSRGNFPVVQLESGESVLRGSLSWKEFPKSLQIPSGTGIVRLQINGEAITSPRITPNGELWLEQKTTEVQDVDSLRVQLIRELRDGSPQMLRTQLHLEVSGKAREQAFSALLPEGAVPISISSALNYRYSAPSDLYLQLRPGVYDVIISSAIPESIPQIGPLSGEPYPEDEFFVFIPNSDFRFQKLAGGTEIDKGQVPFATQLGADQESQVRLLQKGEAVTFVTERKGEELAAANALTLTRTLTLDLTGGGATSKDEFAGRMNQEFRLNMLAEAELGSVKEGGEEKLVSLDPDSKLRGVEVRKRNINLEANSRINNFTSEFSAVGWETGVDQLRIELNLPPGYSLFSASGVDVPPFNAWLHSWNLYEVFFVFLVAGVLYRLSGVLAGVSALVALVLSHQTFEAPAGVFLLLLVILALKKVLPATSAFLSFISRFQILVSVALALQLFGYVYSELRSGLFPELIYGTFGEGYSYSYSPQPAAAPAYDEELGSEPSRSAYPSAKGRGIGTDITELSVSQEFKTKALRIDPNASVQTGPGVPFWRGKNYSLVWNGPVTPSERVKLSLVSPSLNLILSILRIISMLYLVRYFLPPLSAVRLPALAIVSLLLFQSVPASADDFPSTEMLNDLRARLERGECLRDCAEIESLKIEEVGSALRMVLTVGSKRDSMISLPGPMQELPIAKVTSGGESPALRRDNFLQVRVKPGVSTIVVDTAPVLKSSVSLQFPMNPGHVESLLKRWTVDGLQPNGAVSGSLRLSRTSEAPVAGAAPNREEQSLPDYFTVRRAVSIGFPWEVTTTVSRLGTAENSTLLRVPLLPGEKLLDRNLKEENGVVLVQISRGANSLSFSSSLVESPELLFRAAPVGVFSEIWEIDCSETFQCKFVDGIKPISSVSEAGPHLLFQPWPGEEAKLAVIRPTGAEGQTATIDKATLEYRPAVRQLLGSLNFTIRSTQGGTQQVSLPAGANVKTVSIDGIEKPIRGEVLQLPLAVGTHQVSISWEQVWEQTFKQQMPAVDLHMAGVNLTTSVYVPESRWALYSKGHGVGAVVFFWPKLIFIVLMAVVLGRLRKFFKLSTVGWLLLGVGLLPLDAETLIFPLLWFGLFSVREHLKVERRWIFNLGQLALVALTFAFLGTLYAAIQQGLLYVPNMRVALPQGLSQGFSWYLDRFLSGPLSGPTIFSVSIPWVYRPLMFLWSGWLVISLLAWMKWAFDAFSAGELWRSKPAKKDGVREA